MQQVSPLFQPSSADSYRSLNQRSWHIPHLLYCFYLWNSKLFCLLIRVPWTLMVLYATSHRLIENLSCCFYWINWSVVTTSVYFCLHFFRKLNSSLHCPGMVPNFSSEIINSGNIYCFNHVCKSMGSLILFFLLYCYFLLMKVTRRVWISLLSSS